MSVGIAPSEPASVEPLSGADKAVFVPRAALRRATAAPSNAASGIEHREASIQNHDILKPEH
jgi:hypothetical protein